MQQSRAAQSLTEFYGMWRFIHQRLTELRRELRVLHLAARDPRVPWYARAVAAAVLGYLITPIDLIPDWIPVLGYLDDALLVPLGIALAVKLIPPEVLAECRRKAQSEADHQPLGAPTPGHP